MDHSTHTGHHHPVGDEWAAMAAHLELQGEVLLPLVTETASRIAELSERDGFAVRRVLDIGSGPGVGTCEIARCFPSAMVVAVDGSPVLLERAAARAKAAGVSDRVETRQADLPEGLDGLGQADLIWISMVLHHIGDEVAALRQFRGMLNPDGVLVVVEHGDPMRFLPDDVGTGRPGLAERLDAANAAWLAEMRAGLPHATHSSDYPTMLQTAGFTIVDDGVAHVRLTAPLAIEPRRMLLDHLQRAHQEFAEQLHAQDRETLGVLIDEDHPLGIMRRPDAFLDASRHICIARAGVAGSP